MAIEEQVRAYGGPRYQLTQQVMGRFAEAIEHAGVDVVPKIVIGSRDGRDGADGGLTPSGGTVLEALLALLLSDRIGAEAAGTPPQSPPSEPAATVREELRRQLESGKAA